MRRERTQLAWALGALLALCAVISVLPPWPMLVAAVVLMASAPLACFWCARTSSQVDRRVYYWLGAGVLLAGVWNAYALWRHANDLPVGAVTDLDFLTMIAYVCFAVSFLGLVHKRYGMSDIEAWLDAAILGVAFTGAGWVIVVAPVLGSEATSLERAYLLGYASAAVILCSATCRLAIARPRARMSDLLLLSGTLSVLVSEAMLAIVESSGREGSTSPERTTFMLLATACVTAAASHPSARLPEPTHSAPSRTSGRRLIGLAVAITVLPVLGFQQLISGDRAGIAVALVSSVIMSVGVVLRLSMALRRVARDAEHDALTDLLNRRGLESSITQRAHSGDALFALMFVDLDEFKRINDHKGHHIGDETLCAIGSRLTSVVRDNDLVGRLGGDEFAVVLTDLPNDHDVAQEITRTIATRTMAVLSVPIETAKGSVHLTASVGAHIFDPLATPINELLKHADQAMYQAKRAGKGRFMLSDTGVEGDAGGVASTLQRFDERAVAIHR